MSDADILISLTPRHAQSIFSGLKKVELRRKTMHIASGTKAWIYVTLPVGALVGNVEINAIHSLSPPVLWQRFGLVSGLSESEFFGYFDGVLNGTALELGKTTELSNSLSLKELRLISEKFQPPQFFCRLHEDSPILRAAVAELKHSF